MPKASSHHAHAMTAEILTLLGRAKKQDGCLVLGASRLGEYRRLLRVYPTLHPELRSLYRKCASFNINGIQLFGTREVYSGAGTIFNSYVPPGLSKNLLPFCCDGCGNFYCVTFRRRGLLPSGCVCFVESASPSDIAYVCGSSPARFLLLVLREELSGKQLMFNRKFMRVHDPGLLALDGVPTVLNVD